MRRLPMRRLCAFVNDQSLNAHSLSLHRTPVPSSFGPFIWYLFYVLSCYRVRSSQCQACTDVVLLLPGFDLGRFNAEVRMPCRAVGVEVSINSFRQIILTSPTEKKATKSNTQIAQYSLNYFLNNELSVSGARRREAAGGFAEGEAGSFASAK